MQGAQKGKAFLHKLHKIAFEQSHLILLFCGMSSQNTEITNNKYNILVYIFNV